MSIRNNIIVRGIIRVPKALLYSLDGLRVTWINQYAFRQETFLAVVLIPLAVYIPVSLNLKLLLIFSMLIVLVVELLNSAIEATVDMVTKDPHPLAKSAKDCGSAAVFISLLACLFLWIMALVQWLT